MARIATMRTRGAARPAARRMCSLARERAHLPARAFAPTPSPIAPSLTPAQYSPRLSAGPAETYTAQRNRHAGGSVQQVYQTPCATFGFDHFRLGV